MLAATLIAPIAHAQNYEAFYGQPDAAETGQDVKAVSNCPVRGSVIAGTRRIGAQRQALVTRVDQTGVTLWQFAYRVRDEDTTANAIVALRDGSGFALTGANSSDSETFLYVLKIDCEGNLRWTTLLANQTVGRQAAGYDIIETPASATVAPSLVVIGDEIATTPVSTTYGRIARLKLDGGLLWDQAYNQPATTPGVRFRAVTRAVASTGLVTDIVVAGSAARASNWNTDRRALMFRVREDGMPVCNAYVGSSDTGNEDYTGIARLSAFAYANQMVLVGSRTPVSSGTAAYLTRFNAGMCTPLVQALWREPTGTGLAIARDTIAAPPVTGGGVAFAVNGYVRDASTVSDGFLVVANAANLSALITPRRYSSASTRPENLFGIDLLNDRYVMAGTTQTDWDGSGETSPQDIYLVQTEPGLDTECSIGWQMIFTPLSLPFAGFTPTTVRIELSQSVETRQFDAHGEGYCCRLNSK